MKMRNRMIHFGGGLFLISIVCYPMTLYAQFTARGMGMGGAYTALARGIHAPVYNPANLGLPDNARFSFTFFAAEGGGWNNSFNKTLYDKYNGQHWNSQDVQDILSHIPDDGFKLHTDVFVNSFSFSVGRFAFSLGAKATGYTFLDKEIFEIGLMGTTLNEIYNFETTDGEGIGLGAASFSWGQPIPVSFADVFSVGATLHLLYGAVHGTVAEGELIVNNSIFGIDVNGSYLINYALPVEDDPWGGNLGWGFDLGVAAQFGDKWTVSAGLANAYSTVSWTSKVENLEGYVMGDSLDVIDYDDVSDSSWTTEGGEYTTHLPQILRIGVSFKEGPVLLTADYCQGFRKGLWSSTTPQFSMGTEWSGLSWLPLRFGLVFGGRLGFGTSAGLGIRPGGFVLDIAVMNQGFVSPGASKGLMTAIELGIDLDPRKSEDVVRAKDF